MKSIVYSLKILFLIFSSLSEAGFGQGECHSSIKYDDNLNAGKYVNVTNKSDDKLWKLAYKICEKNLILDSHIDWPDKHLQFPEDISMRTTKGDFDGMGPSQPIDLPDVSGYPAIVFELLKRGYKENAIKKILSGNFLRVWNQVLE